MPGVATANRTTAQLEKDRDPQRYFEPRRCSGGCRRAACIISNPGTSLSVQRSFHRNQGKPEGARPNRRPAKEGNPGLVGAGQGQVRSALVGVEDRSRKVHELRQLAKSLNLRRKSKALPLCRTIIAVVGVMPTTARKGDGIISRRAMPENVVCNSTKAAPSVSTALRKVPQFIAIFELG